MSAFTGKTPYETSSWQDDHTDRRRHRMDEKRRHWRELLADPHAPVWERVEAAVLLGLPRTGWKIVRDFVHGDDLSVKDRIAFAREFGYTVKCKKDRVILFHPTMRDRYETRT